MSWRPRPRGLRFTELLDQTGMPKGTLHRLLQALVDERLAAASTGATRPIGWRRGCSNGRTRSGTISTCAALPSPSWSGLRDLTGEAIRLGVLDGDSVLYIDQREVPQPLRLNNGVGSAGRAACQRPRQGDSGASVA